MSAAGSQLTPKVRADKGSGERSAKSKSALARLLHALNQPLTGLQCSMELALTAPRQPEQYVRTLREGVELTQRIRMLAATMREILDMQETRVCSNQAFVLPGLLVEVVNEFRPVAESRQVRIRVNCDSAIQVAVDRRFFVDLIFRLLDSVLSLAAAGSEIGITGREYGGEIQVRFQWRGAGGPRAFEFSPAEVGLLVVETGCRQIGGRFEHEDGEQNSCTMWLRPSSHGVSLRVPEDAQ